jgi:hypothetical protein
MEKFDYRKKKLEFSNFVLFLTSFFIGFSNQTVQIYFSKIKHIFHRFNSSILTLRY